MKKLLLMFALAGTLAFSQTQVAPIVNPHVQLFNAGVPCSGCLLSTFSAGTSTPLVTYSESTGTTPNANPIQLDASGQAVIYLTSASYKFVLKTAAGATIWSQDNISWASPLTTFTGITSTANSVIKPAVAATGGANQSSPTLCIDGFYFNITSLTDAWCFLNTLGAGTNPTSTFTLTHSGSSGAATFSVPGNETVGGTLGAGSLTSTPFVGPIPWYDVTSPFWGAKCDGSTDDTTAIQNALNAANALPRGTVFIPKGKQCKVSSLSTNGFTGVGVVCGLGDSNGRNTSGTGFKLSNATGSLFTSASSFSVSMYGCVLFPSNPAFNGTILDLTASSSDTSNFTLKNSTILSNGSSCAIGLDMNKSDSDQIDNNFFSGCVSMVRGFPAGSFDNVNHLRGGSFLPDSTTTAVFAGAGDSFHVEDATFEMTGINNTISLFDCTSATCSNPTTFGPGNWVGDVPTTWVGIWFKNTSGQFNIEGNVIGGGTTGSAGNEFLHTGATDGGYTIKGNRISGTYNAFLNLQNTSHDCEVTGNTYASFSVTTWIQNPTLCKAGTIIDNNDLASIYGRVTSLSNKVFVTTDFTTASASLVAITGLSWVMPASAANYSFHCSLQYSQATAAVANSFGIQATVNAINNIAAKGRIDTSATAATSGTLPTLNSNTATNIVTFTPSATATVFGADLDGTLELQGTANTVNIMVLTGNVSDSITVKRGSYCMLF